MTLFILDPNLDRESGHHLHWDLSLAHAAMERGEAAVIYANRDFPAADREGVAIRPWFTHTTYARHSTDPISRAFDDSCHFNDILAADLARLPPGTLKATDAVLVPTLNENHLLGYVSWMKGFVSSHAPLFVIHLMFPSGLDVASPDSAAVMVDPVQALLYRLAFRRAEEPGPRIHFYGGGRQLSREYSAMLGREVEAHPIPLCPQRSAPRAAGRKPTCLLFSGDAKVDKGISLAADLAPAICEAHPDWDFLVHANAAVAWGDASDACDRLEALGRALPNLEVHTERLSSTEYYALMERADVLLFTYDPVVYARKSSGALWEAISLGIPTLVPSGCWLQREALDWGAGVVSYEDRTVQGILGSFADFLAGRDALSAAAAAAASRYGAQNGPGPMMDQLGELWARRLLAANLISAPDTRELPIAEQAGFGWSFVEEFRGRQVRWIGQETDMSFHWPYAVPWRLEVHVGQFRGTDQITDARASLGDMQLQVERLFRPDGTARLIIMPQRPYLRFAENIVVRLRLPWAWRPEGETRDLGILLTKLVLGPLDSSNDSQAEQRIELRSAVKFNDARTALLLKGSISGAAVLDHRRDAPVSFKLHGTAVPSHARAVCLFVNGVAVPLSSMAVAPSTWEVHGLCPSAVVRDGGLTTEWDLALDGDVPDDIWISQLTIDGLQLTMDAARPPDEQTVTLGAPGDPAGSDPEGQPSAQAQDPGGASAGLDAQSAHLDELLVTDGSYRHLDLSIYHLLFENEAWEHVKLKICRDGDMQHLEFRRRDGWPDMFVLWPSDEVDNYGELLRLPLGQPLPNLPNERDRKLLRALSSLLESIVTDVLLEADRTPAEVTEWVSEAALHARGLTRALLRHAL